MKTIAFALLFVALLGGCFCQSVEDDEAMFFQKESQAPRLGGFIEDYVVRPFIENRRKNVPDPMYLEYYKIVFPRRNVILSGNVQIKKLNVTRLRTFKVPFVEMVGISQINLTTTYDKILAKSDYSCNVTVAPNLFPLPIYGNGKVTVRATNVTVDMFSNFSLFEGLSGLKANISLNTTKFVITGVLNDKWMSEEVSRQLSWLIPDFISKEKALVSEKASPLLEKFINDRVLFPKDTTRTSLESLTSALQHEDVQKSMAEILIEKVLPEVLGAALGKALEQIAQKKSS